MATPLGQSNHPHCSAHTKPMHPKPPPSSVQHPKASMDVSLTHPSITAFPNSHRHHRQRYLCTCISEATPRLFSFCGGWANPLSRSYSRESAVDETAAFRVGTAQNQPQAGELLCFWAISRSKITMTSPIYCRLMSAVHQTSSNSSSLLLRCNIINKRAAFVEPSTAASPILRHRQQRKKLHLQSPTLPTAALLLWWCHQPPHAFQRPRIHRRRDCVFGTVAIQQQMGELSCFSVFECKEIHDNLTNCFTTPPQPLGLSSYSCSLHPATKSINQRAPLQPIE